MLTQHCHRVVTAVEWERLSRLFTAPSAEAPGEVLGTISEAFVDGYRMRLQILAGREPRCCIELCDRLGTCVSAAELRPKTVAGPYALRSPQGVEYQLHIAEEGAD